MGITETINRLENEKKMKKEMGIFKFSNDDEMKNLSKGRSLLVSSPIMLQHLHITVIVFFHGDEKLAKHSQLSFVFLSLLGNWLYHLNPSLNSFPSYSYIYFTLLLYI